MTSITQSEWQTLEDGLDTLAILRAVDAADQLRAELANPDEGGLFAVRDDLLRLHGLAQAARSAGTSAEVRELFELAQDIELQIGEWMDAMTGIQATLSTITALYPESLAYED
ncbi:transposase [Stenotrophomonas maltophilia]|nr:transposase [Stenotrophomonas maltophilia]